MAVTERKREEGSANSDRDSVYSVAGLTQQLQETREEKLTRVFQSSSKGAAAGLSRAGERMTVPLATDLLASRVSTATVAAAAAAVWMP